MTTSYTIQMASKISGVGVHTIRAWEKRYKALEPNRDSAGHRVYSKSDVEKLMLLSELCLLGLSISKVANLSIEELKASLVDLGKSPESSLGKEFHLIKEKNQIDLSQSLAILQLALKVFKLDVINQELGKIKSHTSPKEMALDILLPLSNEIRALALNGQITPVQEQAANQLLSFHASNGLYQCTDQSELFEVALGLLCHYYGHQLHYLGRNFSYDALVEIQKHLKLDLLILSATGALKTAGKAYVENLLEKIQDKELNGEVLIIGKMELDRNKLSAKKFTVVQTAGELDEFLSKKKNLNL